MSKLDLRKELKHLYAASAKKVEFIDVPEFSFLMIDGRVAPGETVESAPEFQSAMGALYGVTYALKFMSKLRKENPIDYTLMALEGLWWTATGEFGFGKLQEMLFTMMIMQPDHITQEMFQDAVRQVAAKRPNPALAKLRLERFHEGLCVQTMHIGPYAAEAATIEKMKAFASENGYRYRGRHHEIYLGNPRQASPEKLKTVLRQPVEKI